MEKAESKSEPSTAVLLAEAEGVIRELTAELAAVRQQKQEATGIQSPQSDSATAAHCRKLAHLDASRTPKRIKELEAKAEEDREALFQQVQELSSVVDHQRRQLVKRKGMLLAKTRDLETLQAERTTDLQTIARLTSALQTTKKDEDKSRAEVVRLRQLMQQSKSETEAALDQLRTITSETIQSLSNSLRDALRQIDEKDEEIAQLKRRISDGK